MKILLFAALLTIASLARASGVHVGPGQPFPDLNSASHARAIHAGDTVYLHAGTYGTSPYYIDSLIGRPNAWITVRPYGSDSVSIHIAWLLQTVQYVRFTGLNFFGDDPAHRSEVYHLMQFDYAYDCFTRNHDITIDHCRFTDLNNTGKQGSGAFLKFTGCDNFSVDSCTFRDGTNVADGISMNGNRNGVIRNCRFQNISGYGSHTKGGTKNIRYEANLFFNCESAGLDVGGDTGPQYFCPLGAPWECDSIAIYSNVFVGGRVGIQLSAAHHAFVVNNTCFKQKAFAFRLLNASSNNIYVDSNFIANNIFTTTGAIYLNASSNYQYTTTSFFNNAFFSYAGNEPSQLNWSEMNGVVQANNIIANPEFKDTAALDFTPQNPEFFSAGLLLPEPKRDYLGRSFEAAGRVLGAFEVPILRDVITDRVRPFHFLLYPNPVSGSLHILSSSIPHEVTISTPTGAAVLHFATVPESVDVSTLPNGTYYLTVGTHTEHFIIER